LCKNNLGIYNVPERYIFAFAEILFKSYSYRLKRFSFASEKGLGNIKVKSFGIFKNVF